MSARPSEQLRSAKRTYWISAIYNLVALMLLAPYPIVAAIMVAGNSLSALYIIYKIDKLLKSPFLYLSDVESFTKDV